MPVFRKYDGLGCALTSPQWYVHGETKSALRTKTAHTVALPLSNRSMGHPVYVT